MKIENVIPHTLPLRKIPWESFVDLLGKAHELLARFDSVISRVEHPFKVFALLAEQEILSSIESLTSSISLEEWIRLKALNKAKDLTLLSNYQQALEKSCSHSYQSRISPTFLRAMHRIIQRDQENHSKELGRFRTRQNWIGPEGCSIEEAYFYPPRPETVGKQIEKLMAYLSYQEKDPLLQLAIYFAQLLIIHPFMDGNGRVARLTIPLFLY